MLEFIVAVFFLLITPGPGVLTTAGISAAYGFRAGLGFISGLGIGEFINMMIVISGLAAIVLAVPSLRTVLLFASVGYLCYLAFRIASAGAKIGFVPATTPLGFRNGLMLQFINPKASAVNNLIFSGYPFWQDSLFIEALIKFAIVNAIWIPVHIIWLWAGVSLKRLSLSETTQRMINFAMAGSLLIVVALAVLSGLRPG